MVFFFGVNNHVFSSELNIPRFQNRKNSNLTYNLYEAYIKDDEWKFRCLNECVLNNDFYRIKEDKINDNNFFFLAKTEDLKKFDKKKIINFNDYTDTEPEFRANFKIYIKDGGFSSFQSEYPFDMVQKRGTLLSSLSSITNKNADNNYILIRNIFEDPIHEKFKAYFVDIKLKKILETFEIETNKSNLIKIQNSVIKPEVFVATDNYLGIPMYISEKNKHLSFEHTHPPHEYILGENKFKKILELKKEINEIIN